MKNFINDYLAHHGIKGQRWGVKNGPPYPLEQSRDRIYKKGSSVYRLARSKNEKPDQFIYVATNRGDNNVYLLSGQRLVRGEKDQAFNNEYTINKDLKIASRTKLKKIVKQIVNRMSDRELLDAIHGDGFSKDISDEELPDYASLWRKGLTEKGGEYNTFQDRFRRIFDMDWGDTKFRHLLMDELKKQGYDGIQDVFDQGDFSKDPLILFSNSDITLIKMTDATEYDYQKVYDDAKKYLSEEQLKTTVKDILDPDDLYEYDFDETIDSRIKDRYANDRRW